MKTIDQVKEFSKAENAAIRIEKHASAIWTHHGWESADDIKDKNAYRNELIGAIRKDRSIPENIPANTYLLLEDDNYHEENRALFGEHAKNITIKKVVKEKKYKTPNDARYFRLDSSDGFKKAERYKEQLENRGRNVSVKTSGFASVIVSSAPPARSASRRSGSSRVGKRY